LPGAGVPGQGRQALPEHGDTRRQQRPRRRHRRRPQPFRPLPVSRLPKRPDPPPHPRELPGPSAPTADACAIVLEAPTADEPPDQPVLYASTEDAKAPEGRPERRLRARLSGDLCAVGRSHQSRLQLDGRSASRIFIHRRARGKCPLMPPTRSSRIAVALRHTRPLRMPHGARHPWL